MKRMQSLVLIASLLELLVLGTGFLAPSIHAQTTQAHVFASPSCSGSRCNGLNPYVTGCAGGNASWRVIDSVPVSNEHNARVGWLQLWFSSTCSTNWARFSCTVAISQCPFINDLGLYEENSPGCQCGYEVRYVRDVSLTDVHTKQQYLPTVRAQAQISIDCTGTVCFVADTHWE